MSDHQDAKSPAGSADNSVSLSVEIRRSKGVLHELSGVIFRHGGDVSSVAILDSGREIETISFEINELEDHVGLLEDLRKVSGVQRVIENPAMRKIFGKRIIIASGEGAKAALSAKDYLLKKRR